VESFIKKAAAHDDVRELVRLAWAYGGTDNEALVGMELEALATRLRARGKWHDLAYMLNLPANRGIATVVSAVVDQLMAGGADVGPPVVQVARPGSREAKLRAIRVLDGIGEPRLAAELRSRLQDRLVTAAPVIQPWFQVPSPGYAGSAPPGYPVHPQVQYPAGLSGARPGAGKGPVAAFIVSLVSLVVLPLVASFSWGTWSTSGGAAFGVRYPHELIVALVCLVVAIPGPIIYWRIFRRSRGISGHGLATAALIIGIVCFLRLVFNLGIEWAVVPAVLSPGLTPIGPF